MPATVAVRDWTWEASDSAALREFLASVTGRRLAFALVTGDNFVLDPKVSAKYQLGFIAGTRAAIDRINRLADIEAALEQATLARHTTPGGAMYPSLDDDLQWSPELGGTSAKPA